MTVRSKMSEILKELAQMSFRDPEAIPSSEAAHAALLFAQVAWNRALGHDMHAYDEVLRAFLRSNPNLWSELRSCDAETLIEAMCQAKELRYAADRRVVVVCGMRGGNVHAEWCEEKDYPRASELAKGLLDSKFGTGRTVGKRRTRKGA